MPDLRMEARCYLILKMVAKQGCFAAGADTSGRLRGSSSACPSPAARRPHETLMQAAVPADKDAPNRLSGGQTV